MRTRVKVCCIASHEEAAMAIAAGADLLGLVGPMPSGPGPIPLPTAGSIASAVVPGVSPVLLSSATTFDGLVREVEEVRPSVLQIVDEVGEDVLVALRQQLGTVRLLQVLHVADEGVVDTARTVAPLVDGFLLDSGRPDLTVKELGGTGRTHDWRLSRAVVEAVQLPVFLAGGLTPENVVEAIAFVRPFGVDLCSGIRTGGKLDPEKLRRFMCAVRSADAGSGRQSDTG